MSNELGDYLGTLRSGDGEKIYEVSDLGDDGTVDDLNVQDLDPLHKLPRMGDLVELQRSDAMKDPLIAVYVRRLGSSQSSAQFLTLNGKWLHTAENNILFLNPSYVDADLVEAIIPYMPKEITKEFHDRSQLHDLSISREISGPVLKRLAQFESEAQDLYREHSDRFDKVYDLVSDPDNLKFSTLARITRIVLEKPESYELSDVEIFTTRLALVRTGFAFGVDERHHRLTQVVRIRSRAQVAMVNKVTSWLRQFRDEVAELKIGHEPLTKRLESNGGRIIQTFCKRARQFIQQSRLDRDHCSSWIGPSKSRPTEKDNIVVYKSNGEKWTSNETEIIHFLQIWSVSQGFHRSPTILSQPPLILKATGMYEDSDLNEATGHLFLQEIGCILPWENRMIHDENLLLPTSNLSKPLARMWMEIHRDTEYPDLVKDKLESIRIDWSSERIFCIDNENAREIDDGLSIEKNAFGETWVHVHVANPTSRIEPTNRIATMAKHLAETLYTPERNFNMLSPTITQPYFSLASGRPCLTFSGKIGDDGSLIDYKITAGRLGRVHNLTPQVINAALDLDKTSDSIKTIRVGGEPPITKPSRFILPIEKVISTSDILNPLRSLYEAANQRMKYRLGQGGINIATIGDVDIQVWDKMGQNSGLASRHPSTGIVRQCFGDPIIQMRFPEFSSDVSTSGRLDAGMIVRECMLLASEVCARWCSDRKIPTIYRGSLALTTDAMEAANKYYNQTIKPFMERHNNQITIHLLNEYLTQSPPSTLAQEPLFHTQLGMSHYCKVTSPLRRYGDMVAHWQIDAALLEESRRGISLKNVQGRGIFLPFSTSQMQNVMLNLRAREDRVQRAKRFSADIWTKMLIFRAHHFGEAKLPDTLTGYITQITERPVLNHRYLIKCIIKELGVYANVNTYDMGTDLNISIGDEWEIKLETIMPYNSLITVIPTRLIKRAEL